MIWNLLDSTSSSPSTGSGAGTYVLLIGLVVVIVLFMVLNSRSAKKRQQEQAKLFAAIKPGNKVKTIGGVCGVVVEVIDEDNTIILETGSEKSGKSYIKFDKQAIYQTDATVDGAKAEEPKEEAPVAEEPQAEETETQE